MAKAPRRIAPRIAQLDGMPICSTPFCGRPTMATAGVGLSQTLCKRCVQHGARHGSTWCPSIPATTLRPYLVVAKAWVKDHKADVPVTYALLGLQGLVQEAASRGVLPAQDIKWRTAEDKARIAFAHLADVNVPPERVLATHVGVWACIDDDAYAHRSNEYRLVQSAKALHRLASGTHNHYEWPMSDGSFKPFVVHRYPRSSGGVLRIIGKTVDEICGSVAETALGAVCSFKLERYGPHPSRLPGYKPPWATQREKALREAAAKANGNAERITRHVR